MTCSGEVGAELLSSVGDAEDIDQQLGKLEGAGSDLLCLQSQRFVAAATCDHCLLVTQGSNAGAGGCNSYVPVPGVESFNVVLDDFVTVIEVAGVDVHLRAAGLVRGKTTSWPRRSRISTVARATRGYMPSTMHVEKSAMRMTCPSFPLCSEFLGLTACVWGRRGTVRISSVFQRGDSDVLSRGSWAGWFRLMCAPQVEVGCGGIRNRGDVFYLSSHLTPLGGFSLVGIAHTFLVK